MPSINTIRHMNAIQTNNSNTIGQIHKSNSDFIMEQTWDSNIQSKVAYIYDYAHDDSPEKNKYISYKNTTKFKIPIKFIVTSYGSIDKDQVAYHIQFKPNQKIDFDDNDDMYYYEINYRKRYDMTFPIGMYIDIPDEKGVYVKWLICDFEEGNQFTKYQVLPCDYRMQWISIENGKRIKRQMWGSTRSMNSYTAGTWIDRYINSLDDVNKILLPLNNITDSFGHLRSDGENQRIILSAKTLHPLTWKITKVENTKPIGIVKATLDQDVFNSHTDYIEKDDNGNIIGMWANYHGSEFEPIEPEDNNTDDKDISRCVIDTNNYQIRNGSGKFKTLTSSYFNNDGQDISIVYSSIDRNYYCFIVEQDGSETDVTEYAEFQEDNENKNIVRVKFDNSDYIGNVLIVRTFTSLNYIWGEIKLEVV